MEYADLGRFVWAFAFVVGLIILLAIVGRKYGVGGTSVKKPTEARLQLLESLPIDARSRLILVRRDNKQHLLVSGLDGVRLIEADIEPLANNGDLPAEEAEKDAA